MYRIIILLWFLFSLSAFGEQTPNITLDVLLETQSMVSSENLFDKVNKFIK